MVHILLQEYFLPNCLPLYHRVKNSIYSIGTRLSPVYFLCISSPLMSFNAFIIGWQLLSLPLSRLRTKTKLFTLSLNLGTLTIVSVVSVSEFKLSPEPPTKYLLIMHSEFDKINPSFLDLYLISSFTTLPKLYHAILRYISSGISHLHV